MIIEKILDNIRIVAVADSDTHATKIIYDNAKVNGEYPVLEFYNANYERVV